MIGYEVKDDLRLVKVKRLLGLPIYEKKRTDSRLERSFLGGLYRESVRFADFGEASRQSWLLGLPLWGRTLLGHRLRWHIGRSLVVNSFDILSVLSRDLDRLFASVSVRRVDGKKHVYVFWRKDCQGRTMWWFCAPRNTTKKCSLSCFPGYDRS